MAKEQEEAIDYVQKQIDYFKEQIKFIEAVDSDYYDEEYGLYKNRVKQFETVLNMLKEKDKKIERLEKQSKNLDKQAQQYFEQTIYLDKQINLMTEVIYRRTNYKELNKYCNKKDKNKCESYTECYKCIKQYFERKAEQC